VNELPDPGAAPAPFDAPWQAQAFALAVRLAERGVFGWPEWSQALAAQERRHPDRPYWERWVEALESIAVERGLTTPAQLGARAFGARVGGVPRVLRWSAE
jgi:nitrile hydratase accessory protein